MAEEGYKQMGRSIIPKRLKSKVLLIVTTIVLKTSRLCGREQVIIKYNTVRINHYAVCRYQTGKEKIHGSTLKTFLRSLKKAVFVAFCLKLSF